MSKKIRKFIIVDGNALLHRAWHALPPMTTKDGRVVNAVYGFLTTLFKALTEFKPEYLAVTFDRKEKTFRHEAFAEYKAQREKQPDEFYNQLPILKEILEAMNVPIFEKAGFEADDIIGTLCHEKSVDNDEVLSIIVTGDKDALQLVDDNTHVYTLRKGMNDTIIYDEKAVKEKYEGLTPAQLIDFKGLRGDPSDNIPGVPGVGEKTALGLVKQFGSMDEMYQKIKVGEFKYIKVTERLYNLLIDNKEQAYQSRELSMIVKNVPVDFKLENCVLQTYNKENVYRLFQDLEFKSLLNRLPSLGGQAEEEKVARTERQSGHDYKLIQSEDEFESFFKKLQKQKMFVFDTETDGLDVITSTLLGVSFCWEEGVAYYVEAKKEFLEKLKSIFADPKIQKAGQNMKFDIKALRCAGLEVEGIWFDTMIASYLLNPGTRNHNLDDMVFRELGYQMTKITDLIGKGKGQTTLAFVDKNKVADYSCEDADYTFRLIKPLQKELKENELEKLFNEIEMPLVEVLVEMELTGIKIDEEHLKELSKTLDKQIKSITKKVYKLAGQEFNISSPLQLKEILFEKLKISREGIGKTKTGISTAANELEKLHDQHEIIPLIEEYRELTKLQSTYIDALPKLINSKTGRVHTEFNQTITATGRLSSSNPNLQNIPIRTDLGKEIRKAFVADRGYRILSADYSQVELRVIACLAKDKNMMAVFQKGEDIHASTAAKIFEVPLEKVTKDMRSAAKEVNFGVLYGMGAYGLAWRKKISREKAREFIEKYFNTYKDVKKYLEKMKEDAREDGFVQTLFGRRRYLPEINSGVTQIRLAAERMAINMPIQGTAADLMKVAMIEVYKVIKDFNKKINKQESKIKMMLQVHDELVFEVPLELVDKLAKIIDEKMEKIHKLEVPIKVDTEAGKNWQEMEKLY